MSSQEAWEKLGTLIYNDKNHRGYVVKWQLVSPFCKKWSGNRDSDASRVAEMLEYVNKGGYVPKIIHLAEHMKEGLVCYDGNHRREVFNQIQDPDFTCIVDIMFRATHKDIYLAYENINKAVQLPALYLEDSDVKEKIIELVKIYEKQYKRFLSASSRCHAPNFNRDSFTDNLYDIYKHFGGCVTIEQLAVALERLNIAYSKEELCPPHANVKPATVVEKCKKYGLYLFIQRSIPFDHVRLVLADH